MEGDSFHPLRCGALETSRRGAPVADEFHEWNLLQDVFSGRNGGSGTGDSGREKLDVGMRIAVRGDFYHISINLRKDM